jgi:transcriptional regulator with XRE-family HTH domain
MTSPPDPIAAKIKQLRHEAGMSLSELADVSGVSKGYLWKLERGDGKVRPSGRTLYKIARALGTSMSELLGRAVLVDEPKDIPESLDRFAKRARLGKRDVQMLAGISFRGRQPETPEDWGFLWDAIQRSVPTRRARPKSGVKPRAVRRRQRQT